MIFRAGAIAQNLLLVFVNEQLNSTDVNPSSSERQVAHAHLIAIMIDSLLRDGRVETP